MSPSPFDTNDISRVPKLDLLVRVGCSLVYEASHPVSMILNVRPRLDDGRHAVQAESFTCGGSMVRGEEFVDSHGNILHRLMLSPGRNEVRHDALVLVSDLLDNENLPQSAAVHPGDIPAQWIRYTLPSRYCDSDKLYNFAWQQFGRTMNGRERVQAICDWLHANIEYRFGSGRPDISAAEVIQRGYGVCRDFAHTGVALCRAFNIPARYVTGHLPDIGYVDPGTPMDFHAYFEVFLDGAWLTFDPRYNVPRIGRVKISHGHDAVDAAFSTVYGAACLTYFDVWAYQVPHGAVSVGDPIDLSIRLDGTTELRRSPEMAHEYAGRGG